METVFPHKIEYAEGGEYRIQDIVDSLLAQQAIAQLLPGIMERLAPGVKIDRVEIRLKAAEIGSLKEEFFVAFLLAFQSDLKRETTGLVEALTGREVPEEYAMLVTFLVFLVAITCAHLIYSKFRGKEAPAAPGIQGDYNNILNVTAKHLHIRPEILATAVDESLAEKPEKSLLEAAVRFFAPAKRAGSSAIRSESVEIGGESVREFPSEAQLVTDNQNPVEPYPNVTIEVLALDRERKSTGWAARVSSEGIKTKRLSMDLYPTVEIEPIRNAELIRGDVLIEYKQKDGRRVPCKVHLIRVEEVVR